MTDDELLDLLGGQPVCFWLDKDGKPCPRCGKLHMGNKQPDQSGNE